MYHVQEYDDQLTFSGCAPPPGAYDPKSGEKAAGGVVDKSERFKTPKGKCRKTKIMERLHMSKNILILTAHLREKQQRYM